MPAGNVEVDIEKMNEKYQRSHKESAGTWEWILGVDPGRGSVQLNWMQIIIQLYQ